MILFTAAPSILLKRISHIIHFKTEMFLNRNNRPLKNDIYFYPDFPRIYTVCYRVFHHLGINMHRGLPKNLSNQIVFLWKDDTFLELPTDYSEKNQSFINIHCTDISKERVEFIHNNVFGHSLLVDPLTFTGKMVEKSNFNGSHDGVEIQGPISQRKKDKIYQIVVDNRPEDTDFQVDNGLICDLRVPIFEVACHFCYIKYRPINSRFSNINSSVKIEKTESLFSENEIKNINSFCKEFGLNYGEIDIIRDIKTKNIYVIDVNKTPYGPPNGLSKKESADALEMYCTEFLRWLKARGATPDRL